MSNQSKIRISVSEIAKTVGLSRSRFYQLVGTVFPQPKYDAATRRPFYDEELQATCLDVRRRNCGVDGKPVMFYGRNGASKRRTRAHETARQQHVGNGKYDELLAGVRDLGLTKATTDQISSAVDKLFPGGTGGTSNPDVLKAVFVHLERQESED